MKKLLSVALLTLPLAALANPVLSNELLINGGFESDVLASGTFTTRANLTGWTGGANGIELRNAVAGTAYQGSNFVELDTNANSSMSQTFSTRIGQLYQLTFAYAARPDNKGAASDGMSWSAGNMSNVAFGQDTNTGWTVMDTSFVATGTSTTLTFKAIGISDSFGTSLDSVSVHAVPEPASFALALAGLLACGWVARRRSV
jgi:hypothetical protein